MSDPKTNKPIEPAERPPRLDGEPMPVSPRPIQPPPMPPKLGGVPMPIRPPEPPKPAK